MSDVLQFPPTRRTNAENIEWLGGVEARALFRRGSMPNAFTKSILDRLADDARRLRQLLEADNDPPKGAA